MDDPIITLKELIDPALNKLSEAYFACGEHDAIKGSEKYTELAQAADASREELMCVIRKYVADSLTLALGYDPVKGHKQADGLKRMKTMEEVKRAHLQYALSLTDTMDEAARALEIDIATVYRMRKRYGMPVHDQHSAAWRDGKPEAK